jgi:hypothetical protein
LQTLTPHLPFNNFFIKMNRRKPQNTKRKRRNGAPRKRQGSPDQSGNVVRLYRNPRAGPFPTTYPAELHYSDIFEFATSIGTVVYQKFRANSLYDPDETGTGHQPLYFDSLAALYSKYRVTKVRYAVRLAPPNSDSNASIEVLTIVRNGVYTPTLPVVAELPYSKRFVTGAFSDPVLLKDSVDLTTMNCPRRVYLDDDRYAAVVNANPQEVIDLTLAAICNVEITTRVYVDIWYSCNFYDPEPPSASRTNGAIDRPLPSKLLPKKSVI